MEERRESKTYEDKVELIKKIKELEKDLENAYKTLDIINVSKFSNLDRYGFDRDGIHKDTKNEYDPNGFNRNGLNKDAGYTYDPNDFNRDGIHKTTKNEYDPNGFKRDGIHKDTGTFLIKKMLLIKIY